MGIYRLRAGFRDWEGLIDPQELDEAVEASDARGAVQSVKAHLDGNIPEGANMVWLTDEAGNLLWSQRTTDES